jgi:energy-coupling factor transport system substrate-specific component
MMMALLLVIQYGSYALAESTTETSKSDEVHISVDLEGQTEGYSAVLYDNINGLPTSEANAIAETSEGFIWIGSYAGLIRYDGNTFERIGSTGGISSIKCLYVDSRDRLWMGTNDNGVAVMENGEFKLWGKLDGLKSAHTRAITEDENGTIYIATTCGIATIDKDDNLAMLEDDLISEANMRFIIMGNDGLIYGLTNYGDIMTLKDGKLVNYISGSDNVESGAVGAFYPDMEEPGMVYLQTVDYGFCHARMGERLTDLVEIDIQPLSTVQMISSIDGKLWICASNGIGYVENDEFHLLENLPMNNSVGGVMMDYLGNLWFTSTRQGVMKIVPNQFSNLFERFDLPTNVVNTTCMCEEKLFVGSDTGLMVLGDEGPMSSFPLTKATTLSGEDLGSSDLIELLDGCRIRSIIRDSQGRS